MMTARCFSRTRHLKVAEFPIKEKYSSDNSFGVTIEFERGEVYIPASLCFKRKGNGFKEKNRYQQ